MKRQLVLLPILLFLVISTYASTHDDSVFDKPFVLGLDIGHTQTNQIHSVTFPLGYSTFSYVPQKSPSSTRYGISLSRKFIVNSLNNILIGLSYHQFSSKTIKGTLEQGIFPPYYNANYQYNLQSSQLLAEIKAQHQWHQLFYPYLTAGIGWGINTAKQFQTTVPDYLTVTPTFSNQTNSALSYTLGLGVDILLSTKVAMGVGYLFSDLGQVGLGHGLIRNTVLPNYINQSHLYTNTVLAQLSWYIN